MKISCSLLYQLAATSCLTLLLCADATAQEFFGVAVSIRTQTYIKGIPQITYLLPSPYPGYPGTVVNIPGALPFNSTATVTGEHRVFLKMIL
jgi:hypothetical protein